MKNITVKISPDELAALVKKHIENKLAPGHQADVSSIFATQEGMMQPNIPNTALSVTFNIVN